MLVGDKAKNLTRQITNLAAGYEDTDAVNVAQLKAVAGSHTTVSVGNTKVMADNTPVKGGNLELKRTTTNGQYNYDVSLNKDITLGTQDEKNGGSLTINTLGTFHEKDEQGNQKDVPIKEAVKIDGSTISIVKHDGTDGENDQRQVVLGVGPDAGGYVVLYDKTGKKPTYIYNFATLDDGQKYAGDNYQAAETETKTVDGKTTTTIKTDEQNVLLKKLNERLDIKGGATGALTENNIGVNVKDGVMKVQLAQNIDLKDKGSVTMGNTTIENGGVTITPTGVTEDKDKISLMDKGLSNGGKQIAHVDSGLKDAAGHEVELKDATGDVLNNAVNVGDLQKVASAHTAVTVNGSMEAPTAGADGNLGKYTDKEKGNLLLAQKKDTTGKITYDLKLNDNVILGKDGQEGTIGLTGKDGLPGADGKQSYSTTIIKTEKGQAGKDDKTGKENLGGTDITRIVYTDKNGQNPQTVATFDDGLKFAGDDGQNDDTKVITKKLNERLDIVGGAKGDLSDNNIGVTKDDNGKLSIRLAKKVDLDPEGSLKAGAATIGHFTNTELTTNKGNHPVDGSYTIGLGNTDWNVTDPEYVSGRAATEDQLAKVSAAINNAAAAAGKRTVVTVNDKSHPTVANPGTNAYGEYDSDNGNLMIAAERDSDGLMTYNIKLNDNLTIGQKSENGKEGKVTVDTKGGTTVVIGHDGNDGEMVRMAKMARKAILVSSVRRVQMARMARTHRLISTL